MKVLHTSDWHLGRPLYGRKRYEEFKSFLDWLNNLIANEGIKTLLIAGDVFDNSTPSNRYQELYYDFLLKTSRTCCQNIVVIAGNHDSPSFLDAPRNILRALRVYVVGQKTPSAEEEVFVLFAEGSDPKAIVCAVPYLRDRDIRIVEPGEGIEDKSAKLTAGIKEHYREVCRLAREKQSKLCEEGYPKIPIIAMGHLFMAGGKTVSDEKVKEIGSLTRVETDIFPDFIDYAALGHLHIPQRVNGAKHIRYCGSPIPLGYKEANQEKTVIIVEFGDSVPDVHSVPIPCFQPLEIITGSLDEISMRLNQLQRENSNAWLEIEHTGVETAGNLLASFDESIAGSAMEILRIRNKSVFDRVQTSIRNEEMLEDLDIHQVFESCLENFEFSSHERSELLASYKEILQLMNEEDAHAD